MPQLHSLNFLLFIVVALVLGTSTLIISALTKNQPLHSFYGWNLVSCDESAISSATIPKLEIFFRHNELTPEHHAQISSLTSDGADESSTATKMKSTHRKRLDFIVERIAPPNHVFDNFLSSFNELSPYLEQRTFDSLVFRKVPVRIIARHVLKENIEHESGLKLCLLEEKNVAGDNTNQKRKTGVFLTIVSEEKGTVTRESLMSPTLDKFPRYPANHETALLRSESSISSWGISHIDGLFIPSLVHGKAKPHSKITAKSSSSSASSSLSTASQPSFSSFRSLRSHYNEKKKSSSSGKNQNTLLSSSSSSSSSLSNDDDRDPSGNFAAFISPLPQGSPGWIDFKRNWNVTEQRFRFDSAWFAINCRNGEAMTPASNYCNATDPAEQLSQNKTFTEEFPEFIRVTSQVVGESTSSTNTRTWDSQLQLELCLFASGAGIPAWVDTRIADHVVCTVYFGDLSNSNNGNWFGDDTVRSLAAVAAFRKHVWNSDTNSYDPEATYEFSPQSTATPYLYGRAATDRSGTQPMPLSFQEGPGYRPNQISSMTQLTPTPFDPCVDSSLAPSSSSEQQQTQTCPSHMKIKNQLSQGIIEFTIRDDQDSPDGFIPGDILKFFDDLPDNQKIPMFNFATDFLFEGNPNLTDAGETALDVELMMSLSPGLHTITWLLPGNNLAGQMQSLTRMLVDGTAPFIKRNGFDPAVWSMSWGVSEVAISADPAPGTQADKYLQLLQLAGVSFFVSTGDVGAMSFGDNSEPSVSFPASLPHAVAIGGASPTTQFGWVPTSSVMLNSITTGGGFSRLWNSHPSQQNYFKMANVNDIKTYFIPQTPGFDQNTLTNTTALNRRGLPDFSSLASSILVVNHNESTLMSGTSAATPIVAALFVRINYELLARGFNFTISNITDFLYSRTSLRENCTNCWIDISGGDNCADEGANGATGMNFNTLYKNYGCYGSSVGYDAVNGVGVPNYAALLSKALQWAQMVNASKSNGGNGNNNNDDGGSPDNKNKNTGLIVILASVGGVIVIGVVGFILYRKFGCDDDASAANTQFSADTNYRNAAKELQHRGDSNL